MFFLIANIFSKEFIETLFTLHIKISTISQLGFFCYLFTFIQLVISFKLIFHLLFLHQVFNISLSRIYFPLYCNFRLREKIRNKMRTEWTFWFLVTSTKDSWSKQKLQGKEREVSAVISANLLHTFNSC